MILILLPWQVTNLLYQLFTIDSVDHSEMVSPSHLSGQEKKISPPSQHLTTNEKRWDLHILYSQLRRGTWRVASWYFLFPPSGPPDYQALPPLPQLTPRCSRHSAQAGQAGRSKEELAMVNINNFPSVGDLRWGWGSDNKTYIGAITIIIIIIIIITYYYYYYYFRGRKNFIKSKLCSFQNTSKKTLKVSQKF